MLHCVRAEEHVELADDDVESLLRRLTPRERLPRGGLDGRSQSKELVAFARMQGDEVFPGYSWHELRNSRRELDHRGVLCQTGVEIQSALGCAFDCTYCPYTAFLSVRLDVEDFVDRVAAMALARRSQKLFKLNNRTDTLALEPEYGLARALIERFADLKDKHLLLYAKGDAVDHLTHLEHNDKTVASFTLTPEPIAELLEPGAPTARERIEAMRRMDRAGYPVRVRFSPIVPLAGWQEMYRELVAELFDALRPEMVTLWTLSMIELHDLERIVPPNRLDEESHRAAQESAESMRGIKGAPFPMNTRVGIYREIATLIRDCDPTTLVALCLEEPEVWESLADVLTERRGGRFLCNCGPGATSGAVRRASIVLTPPQ